MTRAEVSKDRGEDRIFTAFKDSAQGLSKIWNCSWIPLALRSETFEELKLVNSIALKLISDQYREGHYCNSSHHLTRRISRLDDPELSIVPFRMDYMKNKDGKYAINDINTQPGTPGSFFWEEFWRTLGMDEFSLEGKLYKFFRIFPRLGEVFERCSDGVARVALFQQSDPMMERSTIKGLSSICSKASSYGYYEVEFVMDRGRLWDYSIIEPFYFIRGSLERVISNYQVALRTGEPLGSNLKLEPYTSKDMAFTSSMESYLSAEEAGFLREKIPSIKEDGGVKKRLYGMSGTGYYNGDSSLPWSEELVSQEELFPERFPVAMGNRISTMMCEIGLTSLMVFRGRELAEFYPAVDITVRAERKHPISGPNTKLVPAVVGE